MSVSRGLNCFDGEIPDETDCYSVRFFNMSIKV